MSSLRQGSRTDKYRSITTFDERRYPTREEWLDRRVLCRVLCMEEDAILRTVARNLKAHEAIMLACCHNKLAGLTKAIYVVCPEERELSELDKYVDESCDEDFLND